MTENDKAAVNHNANADEYYSDAVVPAQMESSGLSITFT